MPLIPRDPQLRVEPTGRHASVAAAVSVQDIREAFYEDVLTADQYWWWIREMRLNPMELIVDDDEGCLYRVPFTVNDNDTVTFQQPVAVDIVYVDAPAGETDEGDGNQQWPITVAAAAPTQMVAARWATRVEAGARVEASADHGPYTGTHVHSHSAYGTQGADASHAHAHTHDGDANHEHDHTPMAEAPGPERTVTAPIRRARAAAEHAASQEGSSTINSDADTTSEENGMDEATLRLLGLEPGATTEQIAEAVRSAVGGTGGAAPDADADTTTDGSEPETREPVAAAAPVIPEGMTLVPQDVLEQIRRDAAAGAEVAARAAQSDRERRVDVAIASGRLLPTTRNDWVARLAGPDGTAWAAQLEQLPAVLPTREIGYAGGDATTQPEPTAYPASWQPSVTAARRHTGAVIFEGGD